MADVEVCDGPATAPFSERRGTGVRAQRLEIGAPEASHLGERVEREGASPRIGELLRINGEEQNVGRRRCIFRCSAGISGP